MPTSAFNNAASNDNQATLEQQLLRAAEHGELSKIRALLKEGADINARHTNRDTPLIIAAREGHTEVVRYLLNRKGARPDVTLQNNQGASALHAAAEAHETPAALLLVAAGAPVNAADDSGATAAFYAARRDNEKLLDVLAEAGADFAFANEQGVTPLMQAVKLQGGRAMDKLLRHPCGLNARDTSGWTALLMAVADPSGRASVEKLMEAGADITPRNDQGYSAAALARETGRDELAGWIETTAAKRFEGFHKGTERHVTTLKPISFRPPSKK